MRSVLAAGSPPVLGTGARSLVKLSRWNIRMAEPFLDLGDVGVVVEGVRRGGARSDSTQKPGDKAIHHERRSLLGVGFPARTGSRLP